jgi:hypothetical protein
MLRYLVASFLCVVLSTEVFALGADHPKELLAKQGTNCVHGFFVNWVDVFFFTGDAAACQAFVAEQAKEKGVRVLVTLHPGAKQARSPWDKADRGQADWMLTNGDERGRVAGDDRKLVRVDVWLGGKVKLEDLSFPAEVEVASGGEIEKFIEAHTKQKK